MAQCAACPQHFEVALGEALMCILINRVKRVHEAISKSIGIDIKRRMDEMWNIGPVMAVDTVEAQCRAEALALHLQPDLPEAIWRQLGFAALVVHLLLESGEGDLAHHGVQHVLDFGAKHDL